MVRNALAPFIRKESVVSPAQLMDFLRQIDEQIEELHEEETADTEKLQLWREQFMERHNKLLEEIAKGGEANPEAYSLAAIEIDKRDNAVKDCFFSALISLRNMRGELNRSWEAYQSVVESRKRMEDFKEMKKQESYKEPKRAETITEWDDNFAYLYRRMSVEEFDKLGKATEKKKLEKVTPDNNSRKWLSTSSGHSFAFTNEDVVHSGVEVKEVIVRFKVNKKMLMEILKNRFPAYQTDSYKNSNKNKVLIHQELLAQGSIANTSTEQAIKEILERNEHFNIGFSLQTVRELDKAIVEITSTPVQ